MKGYLGIILASAAVLAGVSAILWNRFLMPRVLDRSYYVRDHTFSLAAIAGLLGIGSVLVMIFRD